MKCTNHLALLFEIGVEEIPSGYFDDAVRSIHAEAAGLLKECGWAFDALTVDTTPRRFVIHASGFHRLSVEEEEKLGPLKEQAYENGQATAALKGFLKNVNQTERDVEWNETPRGSRACVRVAKEPKPLRYFFETLPKMIHFPKTMRWEPNRYPFTRPVRWTFAFVGPKKQTYRIGDGTSAGFTFGHRLLSPKKLKVRSSDFEAFKRLLGKHHVILNAEERIQRIKQILKNVRDDDRALVHTIAHMVEEPFGIGGSFDRRYLQLPVPILTTCMSKYQRMFAQYDSKEHLENRFVAVINGPRANVRSIAKNYESVLRSRLEDARFFFTEDQKSKLESKVDGLKKMMFLGALGSYYDKTKRLEVLTEFLGKELGATPEAIRHVKRAAHLSKADLTSHLVSEFPELQGIAGSEYARLEGEALAVSKAIQDHYLPGSLSEDFQALKKRLHLEGALLGICDRMDLLVGAQGLGIELTSSEDPYALRRAAGSIVKIVRAMGLRFSMDRLGRMSRDQFGSLMTKSQAELSKKLVPFFKERIVYELRVKAGTKEFDLLQGIFESGSDDVAEVYQKFSVLSADLENDSFLRACKVMERTGNILKGVREKITGHVEPSLFQSPLEQRLFDLVHQEAPVIQKLLDEEKYSHATRHYGDVFYQPIHDFFDQVMVNVEDPKVRTNRQSLVKSVNQICARGVADLSHVVPHRSDI